MRLLLRCASALPAALATAPAAAAQDAAAPLSAGNLLQVFSGLVLVLLLVMGAAWALRRVRVPGMSNQAIRMLGAASVGSRERVVLLEVAGTWVLVGVAPGQVRGLATLPKGDLPPASPAAPAATPFAQWLQRFTDRTHAP
jgi:flagellar protein FliO/FliZ